MDNLFLMLVFLMIPAAVGTLLYLFDRLTHPKEHKPELFYFYTWRN